MTNDDSDSGATHVNGLVTALRLLDVASLSEWADELTSVFDRGGHLLVAGNGGSAAQAQHLAAELVGRFRSERTALPVIALHTDTSSVTAIGNDYGFDQVFARQVLAHGRPGDVLLLFSTSGSSENLVRAALAAVEAGVQVWSMVGPEPNPLARASRRVFSVRATDPAVVQECHLVATHQLCHVVEQRLLATDAPAHPVVQESSVRHLVIVGDAFLDTDHDGLARRLRTSSAAPVVENVSVTHRAGGAGLAAMMAAAEADWRVSLVTALGADEAGERVREFVTGAGVELLDLAARGHTATKSRVMTKGRLLARFDQPQRLSTGEIPEAAETAIRRADAVLVSDYGLGLTAIPALRAILAARTNSTPLVWDPHPRGSRPIPGNTVVVPNAAEAAFLTGATNSGELSDDIHHGASLCRDWDVAVAVVTRGSAGVVVVPRHGSPVPAKPTHSLDGDACGAGDRFAVSLTLHLASGRSLADAAARSADVAAGYVHAGGPTSLAPGGPSDYADPLSLVRQVRERGGRVVATAGCFDVLHRGHITLLEWARAQGECLIVCLNNDASVRRLKGVGRPLVPAADRAAILNAVESVDGVLIFAEQTPHAILDRIRPEVYVKGGDYRLDQLPERTLVESWGGRVALAPYLAGRSTTGLLASALNGRS